MQLKSKFVSSSKTDNSTICQFIKYRWMVQINAVIGSVICTIALHLYFEHYFPHTDKQKNPSGPAREEPNSHKWKDHFYPSEEEGGIEENLNVSQLLVPDGLLWDFLAHRQKERGRQKERERETENNYGQSLWKTHLCSSCYSHCQSQAGFNGLNALWE